MSLLDDDQSRLISRKDPMGDKVPHTKSRSLCGERFSKLPFALFQLVKNACIAGLSRVVLLNAVSALFCSGSAMAADVVQGEVAAEHDIVHSSSTPSFILSQPKPFTRPTEYIRPSTAPAWGSGANLYGSYLPWGGGILGGYGAYGAAPYLGYRPYAGWQGWGYGGGVGGVWGYGAPAYGAFGALPGIGSFGRPFGYSALGYGGFGYGGWGLAAPFAVNPVAAYGGAWGYGNWAYGNPWFGGFGSAYGMFGGGGQFNPYGDGWTGGMASRIVQEEPSKASGNYYAPSTVDTTASGSYYAQTDGTSIQVPMRQPETNSSYWGKNSSSNSYWGGSGNPFPKDLNSVPWNK